MRSQATTQPVLLVVNGSAAGQTFPLSRGHYVIGRDEEAEISLPDVAISRFHALVVVDPDGAVSIRDLGSSNGTCINGQRLVSERPLAEGDEIAIGAGTVVTLTYVPATDR